ncbi:hypothetical protein F383_34766 [Gossypium arboreum]|uniref:Uncharacterized protein n=1 Tax=Gossypium arboreum TaxID=29729 RepID=A0A0B0NB93_GOSAR|nr:hypothetical protein F383_37270 [Gossypium arboreum]KHG08296.1 hypothetical protein F383_34792 [Gossypium arboreum]KHG24717.1 hypothetical protein F383_30525 [Gossypium arboreum]KHG28695.1 hypothetical protein F383_34766 [Gossypium arboreum]
MCIVDLARTGNPIRV